MDSKEQKNSLVNQITYYGNLIKKIEVNLKKKNKLLELYATEDTFIDKIYVTPQEDSSMRLDIKIFTGNTTEKYLEKLKRRAEHTKETSDRTANLSENGQKEEKNEENETSAPTGRTVVMSKKMIEAYENGLK